MKATTGVGTWPTKFNEISTTIITEIRKKVSPIRS